MGERWFEEEIDDGIFEGGLPPNLSFHLSVQDAALALHLRTLMPVHSNGNVVLGSVGGSGANTPTMVGGNEAPLLSLRQRFGLAEKLPIHDESGEIFMLTPNWHGAHAHQTSSSSAEAAVGVEGHPSPSAAAVSGLSGLWQQIQRSTSPAPPVSRTATPTPSSAPAPAPTPATLPPSAAAIQAASVRRGGFRVKVREKVRVESQDPALMAVMAKLSALGHRVEGRRGCLKALMMGGMGGS